MSILNKQASENTDQSYFNNGYCIAKNIFLRKQTLLDNMLANYTSLINEQFRFHCDYGDLSLPIVKNLQADFSKADLTRRLAILYSMAGRRLFDQFSPSLNSLSKGFSFNPTLGNLFNDALYQIITHPDLLRQVSTLLGNDFVIGPRIHPIIRLGLEEQDYIDSHCRLLGQNRFEHEALFSLHAGSAPWYSYSNFGLPNAANSQVVNVCIALTSGDENNGGFQVLNGSHLYPARRAPELSELRYKQNVSLGKAEVLLSDNQLFLSHQLNRSGGAGFTALCLQYIRRGDYSGYPHLPAFLVGKNANDNFCHAGFQQWRNGWQSCLEKLDRRKLKHLYLVSSNEHANRLSKDFEELTYHYLH